MLLQGKELWSCLWFITSKASFHLTCLDNRLYCSSQSQQGKWKADYMDPNIRQERHSLPPGTPYRGLSVRSEFLRTGSCRTPKNNPLALCRWQAMLTRPAFPTHQTANPESPTATPICYMPALNTAKHPHTIPLDSICLSLSWTEIHRSCL